MDKTPNQYTLHVHYNGEPNNHSDARPCIGPTGAVEDSSQLIHMFKPNIQLSRSVPLIWAHHIQQRF